MYQTEFLRSLHTNYERVYLEKKPEEHKYQYCILSRGGIKGLLPCSLRYMNGDAFLYYDITSKQNVAQMYDKRLIGREWLLDFVWSLRHIQVELDRFLLDVHNIVWQSDQIFQDVESGVFSFLYIPYYNEENSFITILDFLIDRIDYEDEGLVECVYKIYDRFEKMGEDYLREAIFEDVEKLKLAPVTKPEDYLERLDVPTAKDQEPVPDIREEKEDPPKGLPAGIRSLFEGRKKKQKSEKESYSRNLELSMSGRYVAEEDAFEEDYGKTVYIEEREEELPRSYRIYSPEGRLILSLEGDVCTFGKKRGEVDVLVEDMAASRVHARIIKQENAYYLEDLNSTNGTFKNGLKMQPYEKRLLEEEDEIRIGSKCFIFRSVGLLG